jgi:hypothetical protein
MCWVILNGIVADLFEFVHPLHYLFQLVTYDNFFIALLEFPAPFQASLFLFVNGLKHVFQYGQFVRAFEVDVALVFVIQSFCRAFPEVMCWPEFRSGSACSI